MKALFVGLGSIGTRHLRNFSACCVSLGLIPQVTALRSSPTPLAADILPLVHTQVTSLPEDTVYDVAFICTPTSGHAALLKQLAGRAHTLFIEKPLFEKSSYTLEEAGLGEAQKAYVAAPMRWCGVYKALKDSLNKQNVYSVRSICSSYLPGWRPGADYRMVYSAKREMGGGVTLDLIHEWDYLVDLFGFPRQCLNMRGQFSALEIDSDDLSVYIARYESFLCELHLDYFGRQYRREVEVFCDEGSFIADFGTGTLILPNGQKEEYHEDVNRRYEREMEYFIHYALHGRGESVNSPRKALQVLKLTMGEL